MSSGYSEEDIRRAGEIREWLIKEISDKQEEVERLRTTLSIIDNLLKQGSLKAAGKSRLLVPPRLLQLDPRQELQQRRYNSKLAKEQDHRAGSNKNNREWLPHLL